MTANQKYKESKSELPFKEWLKQEQDSGILADHQTMFNATGDEIEELEAEVMPTPIKKSKSSMVGVNMMGLIGVSLLVYGISQMNKN
tara:strand:+ start:10458 stop:10718 length:261 start_codon:yes stop_codon:yes gene_type:complete